MKKFIVAIIAFFVIAIPAAAFAVATGGNTCSSTSSCKPEQYGYEVATTDDGKIFRVSFSEIVSGNVYHFNAGPFFTRGEADQAATDLKATSNIQDSSVVVQRATGLTWTVAP